MKFRKKPVVIDAIKWTGDNFDEIKEFVGESLFGWKPETLDLIIKTLEGEHIGSKGDWIIKGIKGEFYPCKPDIFAGTYDFYDAENEINQQLIKEKAKDIESAEWGKRIHVESSMERKKNQFSMFIGRWQPLHAGHQALFQQVLDEGGNVLIGIRDGEVNSKNPYTAIEVMGNIMNHYEELINKDRVRVFIVPDICSIEFGRGVGYDIIERIPPAQISEISATKIREQQQYAEGFKD